jgi:hypothetical protein
MSIYLGLQRLFVEKHGIWIASRCWLAVCTDWPSDLTVSGSQVLLPSYNAGCSSTWWCVWSIATSYTPGLGSCSVSGYWLVSACCHVYRCHQWRGDDDKAFVMNNTMSVMNFPDETSRARTENMWKWKWNINNASSCATNTNASSGNMKTTNAIHLWEIHCVVARWTITVWTTWQGVSSHTRQQSQERRVVTQQVISVPSGVWCRCGYFK